MSFTTFLKALAPAVRRVGASTLTAGVVAPSPSVARLMMDVAQGSPAGRDEVAPVTSVMPARFTATGTLRVA